LADFVADTVYEKYSCEFISSRERNECCKYGWWVAWYIPRDQRQQNAVVLMDTCCCWCWWCLQDDDDEIMTDGQCWLEETNCTRHHQHLNHTRTHTHTHCLHAQQRITTSCINNFTFSTFSKNFRMHTGAEFQDISGHLSNFQELQENPRPVTAQCKQYYMTTTLKPWNWIKIVKGNVPTAMISQLQPWTVWLNKIINIRQSYQRINFIIHWFITLVLIF